AIAPARASSALPPPPKSAAASARSPSPSPIDRLKVASPRTRSVQGGASGAAGANNARPPAPKQASAAPRPSARVGVTRLSPKQRAAPSSRVAKASSNVIYVGSKHPLRGCFDHSLRATGIVPFLECVGDSKARVARVGRDDDQRRVVERRLGQHRP